MKMTEEERIRQKLHNNQEITEEEFGVLFRSAFDYSLEVNGYPNCMLPPEEFFRRVYASLGITKE